MERESPDAAEKLRGALREAGDDPRLRAAVERSLSLLEQALRDARQDGLRVLARTIPHELAQPLAEIRGYAELLIEREFEPDEHREILGRIARAATRLGELIHAFGSIADTGTPRPRQPGAEELLELTAPEASTAAAILDELRQSAARRLASPPEAP